ncbi:MAG: type II secretory pathway component PulF [Rhodothermales bacterium]|jgi:type II secretory pathway component PulF
MFRRQTTLSEFYQQLRIVLDAEMALPEALAEIANSMSGSLAGVCSQLATDVHSGLDLPTAMQRHPRHFPAAHVAALTASHETLPALAALCAEQAKFVGQIRKGFAYPLAMITLSTGLLAVLMLTVVPLFAESAIEMGTKVSSVYAASAHGAAWWTVLILACLALLLHVFLMIPGRRSDALIVRLLPLLPGSGRVTRANDYALLCALWSALIRAGQHDSELLVGLDALISDRKLRRRLPYWQEALTFGEPLFHCLTSDPTLERRFCQYLESSEQGRTAALADAGERYRGEAEERGAQVATVWTFCCTFAMIIAVANVMIGLFRPLTQLIGFM